jgi:hypothetical protein
MQKLIAIGALAVLLALPGAMAAELVSTGIVTGPIASTVPGAGAMPIYYLADDGSLWQESNGLAGLQVQPLYDEQGNIVAEKDSYMFGASDFIPSVGEIPLPGVPALEVPGAPAVPEFPLPSLPSL